ncbi:MAG: hypothetical protein FRX49_08221 [Trebouxia sp. A1-2]|nr:MAG: hypothetical protein FRX49_08221 [Trebouxia sp. A1-2]
MQARASEIEAQLTETQNKMQKLQEQKAQLEARNALLEKVSNLCMKPLNTPLADQDYIQAMGACLIQLASGNDASVTDELHQLASEAMTLIACRSKTQQPSVSPVMNEDLMAGTQRNGVMHLDPDHYRRILRQSRFPRFTLKHTIMNADSDHEITSRSIDGYNCPALCRHYGAYLNSKRRKVLMAQLATSDGQVLNPTESILTVEELTRALGQNAAEDRKIFYKVARAVHRGQTAENFVHAYPHIGSMEVMLEVLADQRGEPSKEQLVEYAQTNPMEAEWKRLIRYHDLLGTGMFPEYLPVSTCHLERREALGVTEY